ncbi:hypothetical protein AZ007_000272, partial [Citrobacter freundii]
MQAYFVRVVIFFPNIINLIIADIY